MIQGASLCSATLPRGPVTGATCPSPDAGSETGVRGGSAPLIILQNLRTFWVKAHDKYSWLVMVCGRPNTWKRNDILYRFFFCSFFLKRAEKTRVFLKFFSHKRKRKLPV